MSTLLRKLGSLFHLRMEKIREINRKYAHPRIITRKSTTFALFALRVYLIFVVGVLFYKFFTLLV